MGPLDLLTGTLILTLLGLVYIMSKVEKGLLRLVDANANRAREGLRVAEDVARFFVRDEALAVKLKELRHRLTELCSSVAGDAFLIAERNSRTDLGRSAAFDSKEKSKDLRELIRRNMRRSEEACRVLEETSGLVNGNLGSGFKELRFAMYDAEKLLLERF